LSERLSDGFSATRHVVTLFVFPAASPIVILVEAAVSWMSSLHCVKRFSFSFLSIGVVPFPAQ